LYPLFHRYRERERVEILVRCASDSGGGPNSISEDFHMMGDVRSGVGPSNAKCGLLYVPVGGRFGIG